MADNEIQQSSIFMENQQSIPLHVPLAVAFGIPGALILQQVRYWMDIHRRLEQGKPENERMHFHRGRWWVYNSYSEWRTANFVFMSADTIERQIMKLEAAGALLSDQFNKMAGDKTKWYSIDFEVTDRLVTEAMTVAELIDTPSPQNAVMGSPQSAVMVGAQTHHRKMRRPIPKNTTTPKNTIPPSGGDTEVDTVFNAVGLFFWGIQDYTQFRKGGRHSGTAVRVGLFASAVRKHKPDVTAEDVRQFKVWYKAKYPNTDLKSHTKAGEYFGEWLDTLEGKKESDGAPAKAANSDMLQTRQLRAASYGAD